MTIAQGFIGSANVDSNKIIEIMRSDGEYLIPVHEFSKQALLGEYSHYDKKSSIAYNLFDVYYPDPKEHFLSSLIIGFLKLDQPSKNADGFIKTIDIISEMQGYGFVHDQIEQSLRGMTNKKLIETTERVTFDEGLQGLIGEMPLAFRVTTVGAYHVEKWIADFAYLDAMLIDTPIFDDNTRENLRRNVYSFDIKCRYKRTLIFKEYLDDSWRGVTTTPIYFDWPTASSELRSFESVKKHIDKIEKQSSGL